MGNGAQIFLQFFSAHTDPVVADGQGFGVLIHFYADLRFGIGIQNIVLGEHGEVQFGDCVRGIGDQFPKEHIFIGVN